MRPKIGVYICHCGTNIASRVDVPAVVEHAGGLPYVAVAKEYKFMCSEPGQDMIKEDINDFGLNRVVVASCSPLMHEPTFRKTCESAGLNGYLFQMANIREHCSWVSDDSTLATEKAKRLVSAAVHKVNLLEPLEPRFVDVNPNVLVVGAGIAGIQAALEVANAGNRVYLVEREPCIGGHMAQFDKTFPTLDCAACILTPKMVQVGRHENIELLAHSEVEKVDGYIGNFKVKVRSRASFVDEEKCNGCGDCWVNCPVRNVPEIRKVPSIAPMIEEKMLTKLDEILQKYEGQIGVEIPVLHDIDLEFNYLPEDALTYVAERLEVPVSKLYDIATFFNAFSLVPRGRHEIKVCMGTACFVRGGEMLVERLSEELGIAPGETTKDMRFTLSPVRCIGCCSLAPAMMIDERVYGRLKLSKISGILSEHK
ncbi:NADH-quinone oxidoreductase subunit NuoE [candidate division TA06 bacterium]|uniref:NADH-quinone oxidoreductase subunit NuoE n=1 Tax=candidate division TA06 bacterium TaxID=2250710 RepID=A0A523UPA5_UNCT6|nr:MAG: NADH-quinone oxidoreductase subunit NuoE [candidate division TA06 bacterium]